MKMNKIFGFVIVAIFAAAVFVSVGLVGALNIPPIVDISANPNASTDIVSAITAVGVDLSTTGINRVEIYENGSKVYESSSSVAVYVASHTTAGTRSYYAKAFDNNGGEAISQTIFVYFNGLPIDGVAPTWSDIGESPASWEFYSPSQTTTFSIRWNDNNNSMGNVWINFDSKNYSVSQVAGNPGLYTYSVTGLGAGNHNYTWYAGDTSGNLNNTNQRFYVVQKANPSLTITFDPSNSVNDSVQTSANGAGCFEGLVCKLYRNEIEVSNPDIATLTNGTYTYNYSTTGNSNYNAASTSAVLNVGVQGEETEGSEEKNEVISVNESKLVEGYYIYLDEGDRLKFDMNGTFYYIKLINADDSSDKALFEITPETRSFSLAEKENKEIDLNSDKENDILFRLESTTDSRARVFIKGLQTLSSNEGASDSESEITQQQKERKLFYANLALTAGIIILLIAIVIIATRIERAKNKRLSGMK